MSQNVIQTSLTAGELSPSLFARVDLDKYKSGTARMRNFFVDYRGGASTRVGTGFVIPGYIPSKPIRLIGFQYSVISSYALELGDFYIRFITNGGAVLETAFNLTACSNGTPGTVTAPGNGYANGDWVFITGILGATGYNGKFYSITVSGSVVTLFDVNGVPVDATAFGSYISGGTVARVFKIASPYAAADLAGIKFTQSANILTLTHTSYPPYNLTTTGPTSWTLSPITFGSTIAAPAGASASATAGAGAYFSYVMTAVDVNGQESVASAPIPADNVVNIGTTAGTITLSGFSSTGAVSFNVYKAEVSIAGTVPVGAAYGFVGTTTGTSFIDSNIQPDFSQTPQIAQTPFLNNNPAVCSYFQQRQVFAASITQPMTLWMSQPGIYNNFNTTVPVVADNSIEATLIADEVNEIQSLKAMPGGLIALTAKGAWQISGGSGNEAVTPSNIVAVPQAYNGAAELPVLAINYDLLYVQAKGSFVRDLSYNIYANIYTGTDISVLSNHLFTGYQLKEWAYAAEPYKIVWAIRNDGYLLSLTFLKEQEIYGWARHDTKGLFQSVTVITEGTDAAKRDVVYFVVKRLINGAWTQYIEYMKERSFVYGAEDAWAVDSGVQSVLQTPAAGLTISASSGTANFTADANVFSSGDVGKVIRAGGGIAAVTVYVSQSQVMAAITQAITQVLPDDEEDTPLPVASGDWSLASPATTFSGLDHLNGQSVSILADGGVVPPQVVSNGSITLTKAASKVTAGLGFIAQLQTLRLDTGEPTIQGKRKTITAVTTRCANTRGLYIGPTFDDLTPAKELFSTTTLDQPSPLITGDERVNITSYWNDEGQVCYQLTDPLPATILGIIPEIHVGDTDDSTRGKR